MKNHYKNNHPLVACPDYLFENELLNYEYNIMNNNSNSFIHTLCVYNNATYEKEYFEIFKWNCSYFYLNVYIKIYILLNYMIKM